MNAQQIITFARNLIKWTTVAQITDANMLVILNESYKKFYKNIVNLDRNYFWDKWTADVVLNQYEYSILQPSWSTFGMFKPEKIRIKYTSTSDYVDVVFKDWDSLENTPEYYAESQSTSEPFAIMTDTKYVHIFPTPLSNVTNWLIFEWSKKPYDLDISSTESNILIDSLYHEIIAYLMLPTIHKQRWEIEEKNDAINEANLKLNEALRGMWILTTKVIRAKTKDLSWLE